PPTFFGVYGEWMSTPPPSWADVAWLRELWGGPFMLKGVTRVDDAKRAVDAGVSALSVSNHGGNNLDGTPATIRALPAIAGARVQLDSFRSASISATERATAVAMRVSVSSGRWGPCCSSEPTGMINAGDVLCSCLDVESASSLGKATCRW
ncbi:MAG: pre-mycofactocin synthase, partial [Mycobacterium sp.]|nr:pre-mycofactocin synthase [Mycobacterium sp.]